MPVAVAIFIILFVITLGFLVWLITSNFAGRKELAGQSSAINLIQQQLESMRDSMQKSLQAGTDNLTQSLMSSQRVLSQLNSQIGELQGTNKQMMQLGAEVGRLRDILNSPKLRGQMGEWSLEVLLANALPGDSFKTQYDFKDGRIVDALVKLADFSVPIDAKFPLPAFDKLIKANSEDERARFRKQFLADVVKHIDKIASDYIRPREGTVDFALMFIPAENVYYETVVKYDGDGKDILQYALDKKVIPVSPNLLYAYLMTVAMGLHGMQIEKQAAEIQQNLKKLNADFGEFVTCWGVLGKHLRNAFGQYEEGQRRLDRFSIQLSHIQIGQEEKQIPCETEMTE